ncbi:unnamed protein product [Euphydryas editha]|uniref:Aftiphilin clathrin-binding box domain-containing protein n=1 Tax=Euphydryas editha TaxID=104508 RepID=A0AAU9U416_EUPED|nr:unnamed protein product [Euphydryas editha]
MSIPPLVCSTPPPPEQCEDDEKDHEDFDITYNLSQEDDDEDSTDYNYGNYSGYNIYPPKSEETEKDKWPLNFNEEIQKASKNILKPDEIPSDVNLISDENIKFDDNILEDLNLKVNSDNVHSSDTPTKEYETETEIFSNECSDKSSMIQDQGGTDIVDVKENAIDAPKVLNIATSNVTDGLDFENEGVEKKSEDSSDDILEITIEDKISTIETEQYFLSDSIKLKDDQEIPVNVVESNYKDCEVEQQTNIEFEDFDDFQFTQSDTTQALPASIENPWDNNADEGSDFGDFKANFDNVSTEKIEEELPNTQKEITSDVCDDDFGDFDDFKSVNNVKIEEDKEVIATSNVPVLSFHSSENELQIADSINNVLTTIFTHEICEPETHLDGKLELFLNETWGHLIDIDVRQPYIINWNNSLGQKTLLKALCIDSRNILFGPKWSYNMPKYATNLSTAPLQPQKQHVQSNTSNTESTEKVPNKETASWVDPFTPDGQESCSTDNDVTKTDTMKRPTDLDVFSSEPSTNLNKIYSSTINVQPLRHINLPDTHIFTPTDSETPRSKTIHYDSGPSLVPQQVLEPAGSQSDQHISQPSDINENDNDYWEFQDFKGTVTDVSANSINKIEEQTNVVKSLSSNTTAKAGITYQTQILQPIKLEPIIPTLNWPDPGEVKETFTDFSEFVSSTSWNEKDNTKSENNDINVATKDKDHSVETVPQEDNIEDEFKTFQSAPICSVPLDFRSTLSTQNLTSNNLNKPIKPIYENTQISKENSLTEPNILFVENKSSATFNTSGLQERSLTKTNNSANNVNSDILLPINTGSSATIRSHHNTGQILQPLSLESYSQINWPNPGIDLQDLSRFNPMNSLDSLKCDMTASSSKVGSPAHNSVKTLHHEIPDDDIWGEFVSNVPKTQQTSPKKNITFADDDEWTDFVSSPSIKSQNGLNTISLNVHTNSNMQKTPNHNKFTSGSNQIQLDIPTLNYITPKSNNRGIHMEKHFQNL